MIATFVAGVLPKAYTSQRWARYTWQTEFKCKCSAQKLQMCIALVPAINQLYFSQKTPSVLFAVKACRTYNVDA